jgi:hypothetical protein
VQEIWQNWSIPIGTFNQELLNNFQVEIVCKNGVNGDGDSSKFQVSPSLYFKKFYGWDIKDIAGQETSDMKVISLVASLYTYAYSVVFVPVLPIFYSRLLVKFVNQSLRD